MPNINKHLTIIPTDYKVTIKQISLNATIHLKNHLTNKLNNWSHPSVVTKLNLKKRKLNTKKSFLTVRIFVIKKRNQEWKCIWLPSNKQMCYTNARESQTWKISTSGNIHFYAQNLKSFVMIATLQCKRNERAK